MNQPQVPQEQQATVLTPLQRKFGQDFNRLRDTAVRTLGENANLQAYVEEIKTHYESQLSDCDDTITRLNNDVATLNQLLDDRDRKIMELEERVRREQAKNVRMVASFDAVEQQIKMMKGEVHADDIIAGELPGYRRVAPQVDHQIREDLRDLEADIRGERPTHPALGDPGRPEMMQRVVADISQSSLAERPEATRG